MNADPKAALAAWDYAVDMHRVYWAAVLELHMPTDHAAIMEIIRRRDSEASGRAMRFGLACPDAVANGNAR